MMNKIMGKSLSGMLKEEGYKLKHVFGYFAGTHFARFNRKLLDKTTYDCLEKKIKFTVIPAEFVPEEFEGIKDLTNRYAIYIKE